MTDCATIIKFVKCPECHKTLEVTARICGDSTTVKVGCESCGREFEEVI